MEVVGNFLLGCLLVIIGAVLIAGQFACTIDNAMEKYKKENDDESRRCS
jgi:hypothetical protein